MHDHSGSFPSHDDIPQEIATTAREHINLDPSHDHVIGSSSLEPAAAEVYEQQQPPLVDMMTDEVMDIEISAYGNLIDVWPMWGEQQFMSFSSLDRLPPPM